jgi:very-short-patch-repair endonuclease
MNNITCESIFEKGKYKGKTLKWVVLNDYRYISIYIIQNVDFFLTESLIDELKLINKDFNLIGKVEEINNKRNTPPKEEAKEINIKRNTPPKEEAKEINIKRNTSPKEEAKEINEKNKKIKKVRIKTEESTKNLCDIKAKISPYIYPFMSQIKDITGESKFLSGKYSGRTLNWVTLHDSNYISIYIIQNEYFFLTDTLLEELQKVSKDFILTAEAYEANKKRYNQDGKVVAADKSYLDGFVRKYYTSIIPPIHHREIIKLPEKIHSLKKSEIKWVRIGVVHDVKDVLDKYPVIIIPESIKKTLQTQVSEDLIFKELNIKFPTLKLLQSPVSPRSYYYESYETTEVEDYGYLLIIIFFSIAFLIGLASGAIIPILVFGSIAAFYMFGTFRTVNKSRRIEIPSDLHQRKLDEYKIENERVINENNRIKEEHELTIKQIKESIRRNDFEKAELAMYYKDLRAKSSYKRNLDNRKRGKSELMFLDKLHTVFGNQIKVDVSTDEYNYFPDFVFHCQVTNMHIDIEIDEPYALADKEPIHYIDSDDERRNHFFLEENWCVIRFSEKQIVEQSDNCIKLINQFVTGIRNKNLSLNHNVIEEPKWTYEEARVMSYNKIREKYLVQI